MINMTRKTEVRLKNLRDELAKQYNLLFDVKEDIEREFRVSGNCIVMSEINRKIEEINRSIEDIGNLLNYAIFMDGEKSE